MFANPIMLPFIIYQRWLEMYQRWFEMYQRWLGMFFFPSLNNAEKIADAAMDNVKSIQAEVAYDAEQIAKAPTSRRLGRRVPYISARIHKARK